MCSESGNIPADRHKILPERLTKQSNGCHRCWEDQLEKKPSALLRPGQALTRRQGHTQGPRLGVRCMP